MNLGNLLSGGGVSGAETKSWHSRISNRGKFRDAEFVIDGHDHAFGRRSEVNEFPLRDKPYVQDLGKKYDELTLELFVVGSGYDLARNRLIAALSEPGPGTLVHPHYGTLRASVINARVRESTREGGMASFSVTFVADDGLALSGAVVEDTGGVCRFYADKSLAGAIADFGKKFSVLNQADDFVQSVLDELDATLGAVEKVVGNVTGSISALIRAPAEMAAAIAGSINNIGNMLGDPFRALSVYRTLFGAGSGISVPLTTINRKQQAANIHAVQQLVRRVAVIEASRSSSQAAFVARDDALLVRAQLGDAIDVLTEVIDPVTAAPISDEVYQSLVDLRAAVVRDLAVRGARLPELKIYTPTTTLPALVVAYSLYGDAARADEIIGRNKIARPSFVSGGRALEVISV